MRTKMTALLTGFLLAVVATVVMAVGKPGTCIWPCGPQWQTITLAAGLTEFAPAGTFHFTPQYWKDDRGVVCWRGHFQDVAGGKVAWGVGAIPAEYRPTKREPLAMGRLDAVNITHNVWVNADGTMGMSATPAGTAPWLGGCYDTNP